MSQMGSLNAVRILKGEAEEEKAETARLSSFVGAIAIGDLMKSTLGPKGMVSWSAYSSDSLCCHVALNCIGGLNRNEHSGDIVDTIFEFHSQLLQCCWR